MSSDTSVLRLAISPMIEVNTIDDKSLMSRNTLTLKSCTSVAMVVNT